MLHRMDLAGKDSSSTLDFQDYYSKRVQKLEAMRKAHNRCANKGCTTEVVKQMPAQTVPPIVTKLRTEMVSLMEQDLILMRQLLALHDTVMDVKASILQSSSSSDSFLSLPDEDLVSTSSLLQNGDICDQFLDDNEADKPPLSPFGRNNSVLRIPIPPTRQPRQLKFKRIVESPHDVDDTSSGVSTASVATTGSKQLCLSSSHRSDEESSPRRRSSETTGSDCDDSETLINVPHSTPTGSSKRSNHTLCGIETGAVKEIDSDTLSNYTDLAASDKSGNFDARCSFASTDSGINTGTSHHRHHHHHHHHPFLMELENSLDNEIFV